MTGARGGIAGARGRGTAAAEATDAVAAEKVGAAAGAAAAPAIGAARAEEATTVGAVAPEETVRPSLVEEGCAGPRADGLHPGGHAGGSSSASDAFRACVACCRRLLTVPRSVPYYVTIAALEARAVGEQMRRRIAKNTREASSYAAPGTSFRSGLPSPAAAT
jgi:hypothetical protein